MKIYSVHNVLDGKWSIKLMIKESNDFTHRYESRPDLRKLIDENYHAEPVAMAKILLNQVMDCESVEISLLCGPAICIVKRDVEQSCS